MPEVITIKTGELATAQNHAIIQTGSVGSCVVIAIYDHKAKIGGLAHAMLPTRSSKDDDDSLAKYSDEAVSNLVLEIEKIGGNRKNFVAKLVGGGAMFKNSTYQLGDKNVKSARRVLTNLKIHIENEDTGGNMGKSVEMNLGTGIVKVETSL